jgi:predicted deacylase
MASLSNPADPSLAVFPDSYAHARALWERQLTGMRIATGQRTFPVQGTAPDGTPLATDTAWLGPPEAPRVLVLLAGTHGIEGFAGTAVLCDTLAGLAPEGLAGGLAVLCVHALNPWGYAWHRRCDADGVDLNRNCIDFDQPLPENPGYDELRPWLFEADGQRRQQAFQSYIDAHGRTAFEIALSGGQYHDPAGPFYGGRKPCHGRRVVETLMADYRLAQRRLAVIDLHTGLGEWGCGEIICDHPPASDGATTAQRWYGEECTLPALGTSSSVPKIGLLDYAWHAVMPAGSCYITLEYGTYPTQELFEVLLRDHRFWAVHGAGTTQHPQRAALIRDMRAHFCPDDPAWRRQVLLRAREVIRRARHGLLS